MRVSPGRLLTGIQLLEPHRSQNRVALKQSKVVSPIETSGTQQQNPLQPTPEPIWTKNPELLAVGKKDTERKLPGGLNWDPGGANP